MAISTLGTGNLNPATLFAVKELLDRVGPQLAADPYVLAKECPMNSTNTIVFGRSVVPDSDTSPSLEGINKASRQFTIENMTATMYEFEESYAFSSQQIELGEYGKFLMGEAKGNLSDLALQTREEYGFSQWITGDNVLFNSDAITSRGTVNGGLTLGRLDRALRILKANRAPFINEATTGALQQGTVPVAPRYVIFGHTDLEADFRGLAGYKEAAEVGGIKEKLPHHHGTIRNFDVVLSPHFKPLLAAGAAVGATGMRASNGVNIDVYPLLCFSKHSLGRVSLKGTGKGGYGNIKINMLTPDQIDKSDFSGKRGYVSCRWYDAALILRQAGVVRIEVGSVANPS